MKNTNVYFPHIENLLNNPAMVFLQCLLVGFGDIDPNQVGVVLISVSICQTLQQDLYETETPAGETRYLAASPQQLKFQHALSSPCVLTFWATSELMLLQL